MSSTHNVHMYPDHTSVGWTYKPWCEMFRHYNIHHGEITIIIISSSHVYLITQVRGGGQLGWLIFTTQLCQAIGEYYNQNYLALLLVIRHPLPALHHPLRAEYRDITAWTC